MRFADIIGQQHVKQRLIAGVKSGRVPHTQFFLGNAGSGALGLALAYIQYLHCTQITDDDSCGECVNCKQMSNGVYPDLRFTYPYYGSKSLATDFWEHWVEQIKTSVYFDLNDWSNRIGEGKMLNIPSIELAQISHHMSLQPYADGYKVQLIWLPEFLGKEANSLLKIIEEPPEKSLFILVGGDAKKVLNTIVSRTQLVNIAPVDKESMEQYLLNRFKVDEATAARVANMSGGDVLVANELMQNADNEYLDLLIDWLRLVFKADRLELMRTIDENISKRSREYKKGFLLYLLEIFRATLLHKSANMKMGFSAKESEFIAKLIPLLNADIIEQTFAIVDEHIYNISRNINEKLIFTELGFKMMVIVKSKKALGHAT